MFDPVANLPKKRIYRIGASFLVAFIAVNILVGFLLPSYKSTLRASEKLLKDNVCNFSYSDFDDISLKLNSDSKPKIFLLGDSVSYGIGVMDEKNSISGFLREKMSGYSVYNLSSCGSKPLDYYLWVSYLTENYKNSENIFLIQYNYKWFSLDSYRLEDKVSQKRIILHFNKYLDDEISEKLKYNPGIFERLHFGINTVLPVSANKVKLFAEMFNEKSKEELVKNLFLEASKKDSFDYKTRYWREKEEMTTFNCKISYGSAKWNPETNFNYEIYLKTLELLEKRGQKALVFMPPYNSELTKKCQGQAFKNNIDKFLNDAGKRNINSASFTDLVDEKMFLDDMHLSKEGNLNVASQLSQIINNY
jgi:hypothetical protein